MLKRHSMSAWAGSEDDHFSVPEKFLDEPLRMVLSRAGLRSEFHAR
jgi:hypothetical protein